jgi:hypothetical protein
MNCATQQTTSSHIELRPFPASFGDAPAMLGAAVVSTLMRPRTTAIGARPMRRTPRNAMLTTLAILASSVAVAGCGGKATSSSSTKSTTSTPTTTTTTTTHKHSSKPAY